MVSQGPNSQAIPESMPLHGLTVLLTRPQGQTDSWAEALERWGAKVVLHPVIKIGPPADWKFVDQAIARLNAFDWIVFVSTNGVDYFLQRCGQLGVRPGPETKIAAIGSKTAAALENAGLEVDLVPEMANSEGIARSLIRQVDKAKLLLVRANRGSRELPDRLQDAEIEFEQISVYQSTDVEQAEPEVLDQLKRGEIHWVTVSSSAIARATVNLFGDSLKNCKLVSISPTTSKQLLDLGFEPSAEAAEYNLNGVLKAIQDSIYG